MRDLWQTTEMNYGAKFGVATYPKQLKSLGIKSLIERALKAQGLVKPLSKEKKERRRERKGAHGMRKYYQTNADQRMKSINVEILMGHSIGVSDSYYRPKEKEILEDYLKAIDNLTIGSEGIILNKQLKQLEEKSKEKDYITSAKLQEKNEEIENLYKKDFLKEESISNMADQLLALTKRIQELENKY